MSRHGLGLSLKYATFSSNELGKTSAQPGAFADVTFGWRTTVNVARELFERHQDPESDQDCDDAPSEQRLRAHLSSHGQWNVAILI